MIKPFEAYTWKELMLATPLFGPSITLLGLAFPVAVRLKTDMERPVKPF